MLCEMRPAVTKNASLSMLAMRLAADGHGLAFEDAFRGEGYGDRCGQTG